VTKVPRRAREVPRDRCPGRPAVALGLTLAAALLAAAVLVALTVMRRISPAPPAQKVVHEYGDIADATA
jgi:hypothetical protein